jgi:hypothetical protein
MPKAVLIVCAVGAVCLVLFGGGVFFVVRAAVRVGQPPEFAEEQWKPLEVPNRFKVLFPGQPRRTTQPTFGLTLIAHAYEPNKDVFFGVTYSEGELPPERRALPVETLLSDAYTGAVSNMANMGAKEVSHRSITLGPHPGKETKVWIKQVRGHAIVRIYLVHGRLYIVMLGGKGYDEGQPNVNRFLDSFEILDTGGPPPAPQVNPPTKPAPGPMVGRPNPAAGPPRMPNPPPKAAPVPGPVVVQPNPPRPRPVVPQPAPIVRPPAAPQPQPAAVARLDLPPLPEPIEIKPAPIKAETPYKLPETVSAVRVGGGGRFLVLHFPKMRKLGIFDVNEAKIVRFISLSEDDVHFAAGMTKLLVFLPGVRLLQRYDLLSGQREKMGRLDGLPEQGKLDSFCMGHASAGPLLISTASHGVLLYNPDTFRTIPLPTGLGIGNGLYWAGATGRVFGFTGNGGHPNGVHAVVLDGAARHYGEHRSCYYVMPGPDDRHVYPGGHGVLSVEIKPVTNVPLALSHDGFASHLYLPAAHGPFYLHAMTIGISPGPEKAKQGTLTVFMLGNKEPIATFENTVVCGFGSEALRGLGIEHTIHLVPKAKLLVVIPATRDELRLYPADLDAALDKAGRDLLYTSTPPAHFAKGKPFRYQAEVKAKKGPVTFKVESGPPGLAVDKNGLVTWAVPADFAEQRVEVILAATDAAGQDAFQTLTLTAE